MTPIDHNDKTVESQDMVRDPDRGGDGLDLLAHIMDEAITIPGTSVRVGLDAVLGLVPIAGDTVSGLIQSSLILIAWRDPRVSGWTALRMLGNVGLETTLGAIPLVGDLFDVSFKATSRNLRLLREARRTASG